MAAISNMLFDKIRLSALFCFVIMLFIAAGQPTATRAADKPLTAFKNILNDTIEALWTGQAFSPELKQRQQTFTDMLATGAVNKAELEIMTEAAVLSMLERHKTSRYILKTFPERVNALFSPHLEWPAVKQIMWRALSSVANKDDPILIKIGTLGPPGTPWLSVPETIILPEIEKLSAGKLLVKIYGGGVMGEDTDVLEKMADEQLDGCGCTALGVLEAAPGTSALLMPGLFNNYEEVDYICEKFRKRLDQAFEEKGYILGSLIDSGFFYLFSKNKINGLGDLKKQKLLSWFGAIETALYQEMGMNAMSVAAPDVVSSLNIGLGDVVLAPAGWMLGMQAYQYVNFYLKQPLLYSPSAVFVNSRTLKRLRKQLGISPTFTHNIQEIIVSEFNAFEPEWNRQIRDYEKKSLKAFETRCGIKAVTFSPEDQQIIERASKTVQQKLAGTAFPKDLIDNIQKALEAHREQQ